MLIMHQSLSSILFPGYRRRVLGLRGRGAQGRDMRLARSPVKATCVDWMTCNRLLSGDLEHDLATRMRSTRQHLMCEASVLEWQHRADLREQLLAVEQLR